MEGCDEKNKQFLTQESKRDVFEKEDKPGSSNFGWLTINSFPDISSDKQEKTDNIIQKIELKDDEDYIEFEAELYEPNKNVLNRASRKYKKHPEKIFEKARKMRRKALYDLSKEKPMLIDKFDPQKLKFFVCLRGERKIEQALLPIPKYSKKRGIYPITNQISETTIPRKNRYFSKPKCDKIIYFGPEELFTLAPITIVKTVTYTSQFIHEKDNVDVGAKITSLNKKVTENPNDVDSWLKLVDLQKFKLGSKSSESAIAESQIAVLEKAISKNQASEILLLRQLYITHNTSDPNSLRSVLDQTVFNHPNKISFWTTYFEYNMADFSRLNQTKICDIYSKALHKLESLKSPLVRPSHRLCEPLGSHHQIIVIAQLALYLLSTGYSEKLIAFFQSLLDFNLAPIKGTEFEKLKSDALKFYYETFWDSKAPRFGEIKFESFLNFSAKITGKFPIFLLNRLETLTDLFKTNSIDEEYYNNLEIEISKNIPDLNKSWIIIERMRSNHHALPKRIDEEVEDNEKIIVFDDISSFLFRFDNSLHFELCLLFLLILGIPVPFSFCPTLCELFKDNLINTDYVLQLPYFLSQFETIIGGPNLYLQSRLSPIWIHFGTDTPEINAPFDLEYLKFIRTCLAQLLSLSQFSNYERQSFSVIWLQFEILMALLYPLPDNSHFTTLVDLSKKILELEENRSHPPIWILYSFCLVYSGQTSEYVKTMRRVVKSFLSISKTDQNTGIFVRFFSENVFLNNLFFLIPKDHIKALIHEFVQGTLNVDYRSPTEFNGCLIKYISSLSNDQITNCMNIIVCQFFESLMDDTLDLGLRNYIKWIEFCYNRCKIETELQNLKYIPLSIVKLELQSPVYKLSQVISEYFAVIIWHPSIVNFVDFKSISSTLYLCLSMFPHSVPIQQWHYRFSTSIPIFSTINSCFNRILSKCLEPTSHQMCCWIFSIYTALSYLQNVLKPQFEPDDVCNISNLPFANHLKDSFERICEHPSFRFRPLVWRLYLRTMHLLNDNEGKTSVFYRALQHTPWSKVGFNSNKGFVS